MTTTTYRTADDAIARSISHNEIVTLDYDHAIAMDLLIACEDSTDANDGLTEYCGTDDGGNAWRVHMRADARPEPEADRVIDIDGVPVRLDATADEDHVRAIWSASDDGGIIQAVDMVDLFPGHPTRHTTTRLASALGWAGAEIVQD